MESSKPFFTIRVQRAFLGLGLVERPAVGYMSASDPVGDLLLQVDGWVRTGISNT